MVIVMTYLIALLKHTALKSMKALTGHIRIKIKICHVTDGYIPNLKKRYMEKLN